MSETKYTLEYAKSLYEAAKAQYPYFSTDNSEWIISRRNHKILRSDVLRAFKSSFNNTFAQFGIKYQDQGMFDSFHRFFGILFVFTQDDDDDIFELRVSCGNNKFDNLLPEQQRVIKETYFAYQDYHHRKKLGLIDEDNPTLDNPYAASWVPIGDHQIEWFHHAIDPGVDNGWIEFVGRGHGIMYYGITPKGIQEVESHLNNIR